MRTIHTNAERRISQIAEERAQKYDSSILHNTIHDGMPENDQLRHVADVVARSYELEEKSGRRREEQDDVHDRIWHISFTCAEDLNEELENLADDVEKQLLKRAASNLDWDGHSEESVERAKMELTEAGIPLEAEQ